jgi:hypothetical protein
LFNKIEKAASKISKDAKILVAGKTIRDKLLKTQPDHYEIVVENINL